MDLNLVVIAGRLAAPAEIRTAEMGPTEVRYLITVKTEHPRPRVDVVPVTLVLEPGQVAEGLPGQQVFVAGAIHRSFGAGGDGRSRLGVRAKVVEVRDSSLDAESDGAGRS